MTGRSIALVTDAWSPQVNGVVRTLGEVTAILRRWGHDVSVIAPDQFRSLPCPTYPDIRLALVGRSEMAARLNAAAPEFVHLATEGPLGIAARAWCLSRGMAFTTAYHTQFPDYLSRRTKLPASTFWPYIRWFHRPSAAVMVATETIRQTLEQQGLTQTVAWGRGVDLSLFARDVSPPDLFWNLPRPIQLYVGRVAVEKNIEAFLRTRHPGTKVVVGDGPARARLEAQFPEALFLGTQTGQALAACYAGADVMVFPSRTDTFGLVMIEALACGTPVAALPAPGPLDVLTPQTGSMDDDLERAIAGALALHRGDCAAHARCFTWEASARQFLDALVPAIPAMRAA